MNGYYAPIDCDDFLTKIDQEIYRLEIFEEHRISSIKKKLKNVSITRLSDEVISINLNQMNMEVYMVKDEWYYLYSRNKAKCYKCDQLDGLLKCLRKQAAK